MEKTAYHEGPRMFPHFRNDQVPDEGIIHRITVLQKKQHNNLELCKIYEYRVVSFVRRIIWNGRYTHRQFMRSELVPISNAPWSECKYWLHEKNIITYEEYVKLKRKDFPVKERFDVYGKVNAESKYSPETEWDFIQI